MTIGGIVYAAVAAFVLTRSFTGDDRFNAAAVGLLIGMSTGVMIQLVLFLWGLL